MSMEGLVPDQKQRYTIAQMKRNEMILYLFYSIWGTVQIFCTGLIYCFDAESNMLSV